MNKPKHQILKQIIIEIILFIILGAIFIWVVRDDYYERPGIIKAEDFNAIKRTDTSITLEWPETRNTDSYIIYYKKKGKEYPDWTKLKIENSEEQPVTRATINNLQAGTDYCWVMRADNDNREGFETEGIVIPTKTRRTFHIKKNMTKLVTSKSFKLHIKEPGPLTYESNNKGVVTVDRFGKVHIKGSGSAVIKVIGMETKDYVRSEAKINIDVLDAHPIKSYKAKAKTIYNLTTKNCKALFSVRRGGTPQSMAYTGKKYIVAYNGGSNGLAIYSKKGKLLKTERTGILGHANGLTYCNNTNCCYGVRGSSSRVDIYDMKTGKFSKTSSKYGGSGIAYDRVKDVIYLSSRTGIRVYSPDGKFTHKKLMANCSHSGYVYTQDCCGHAGIVIRCCSGNNKHRVNYIDLYRVKDEKYIGSFFCNIGEVESAIVDNEGYLELLINSRNDYIWKTPINIEDLAK